MNGEPSPAESRDDWAGDWTFTDLDGTPLIPAPQSPQERARVERWATTGCVHCGALQGHETGCWYLASP